MPEIACEPIAACETGDNGKSRQLKIVASPSGPGGMALTGNFKELHFRQPGCNYAPDALAPSPAMANAPEYCVGSRWLDNTHTDPNSLRMWICVFSSDSSSIWVPFLRWLDDSVWSADAPNQKQVLVVDYHFGIDGELRRIAKPDVPDAPLIFVPKGNATKSALILGRHDAVPGGEDRGAYAVDFQNTRAAENQVAAGPRSFVAGGKNNRAAGEDAHAHGVGVEARGNASHAQGYSSTPGAILANGVGSHAAARTKGHVQRCQDPNSFERLRRIGRAMEGMLLRGEFHRDRIWPNIPPAYVHHVRFGRD